MSVLATFSVLKNHVNFKVSRDSPAIDNIIFKLHYRATFLILLASTILVSSRQFIGWHIRCIADTGIPSSVIDSFCFFTSTFTVVKHMNATALAEGEIPHPGVGPAAQRDEIVRHAYYQWVPFVLFFQALLFYLPHYLWRTAEGGRLKTLVSGLHMASISLRDEKIVTDNGITIPSKFDKDEKIYQIRTAFLNRLHLNRPWAYYLSFCEVMNFLNVLTQMYITNKFLGGAFLYLGHNVAGTDFNAQMDILDEVFPKVTKCTFHKYGPSGGIQKHDALCVMALNIINEKIYTFLWFWFIILTILSGLALIWRILTMTLHSRSTNFNKLVFMMACPGKYNPWDMLKVTNEYYFGDWLFLYYIAKNVENYVFKELLQGLAQDLEERKRVLYKTLPQVEKEPLKETEYRTKDFETKAELLPKMILM
ncbi:PREDICTED: innexin inx7 [Ceratosolen solmsi marchali]|uniref:Innexin n=1 Tax=Ceratosolen solmsi marchali TaxID=326594 RepID=A0AAJ6YLQ4_9HYME|nr:PREDICTED: innexin inx7 [Ceratosolen solmsi marchali]